MNSKDALQTAPADDARDLIDIAEDRKMTEQALERLGQGGKAAYEGALKLLRADTLDWWLDETSVEDADYAHDAEGLKGFIEKSVLPVPETSELSIGQPAAVRLQAHGESVDPLRLDQLHKLDERLGRQFEQTLRALERVQGRARKRPK